jgi:hypothetical protein
MCLIIHKPADIEIPSWVIESAHESNSDGVGIMSEGSALKWRHLEPETIIKKVAEYTDKNMAIHFRYATHGKVNKSNAHPFRLKNKGYLMHNGVLSAYAPKDRKSNKSDTRNFVDTFCNPMISKHGSIPKVALEREIWGSTICLMARDGVISRYGSGWSEHYGLFFSNEYAWDSPTYERWNAGYGSISTYASDTPIVDSGSIWESYEFSPTVTEQMLWSLQELADLLPLNDASYIAYEDMPLQDELLDCLITVDDFLEFCTDETLHHLHKWGVDQNLIAA